MAEFDAAADREDELRMFFPTYPDCDEWRWVVHPTTGAWVGPFYWLQPLPWEVGGEGLVPDNTPVPQTPRRPMKRSRRGPE